MKHLLRKLAAQIICRLPKGLLLGREFFELYERHGFHVTHVHFYQPVPDTREITESDFTDQSEMIGIKMDVAAQKAMVESDDFAAHFAEFGAVAKEYEGNPNIEVSFAGLDGAMLYHFVRETKPRRMVEIGSGFSTILSSRAGMQNAEEGAPLDILAIEPYPQQYLLDGVGANVDLKETKVQNVDFSTFEALDAGDILFIDSSHVVSFGSDVVFEVNEILPRLKPGVIVHIHDIPMPFNYSREWVKEKKIFWSELYIIQAFLQFNDSFEVVWSAGMARSEYPDAVQKFFPEFVPEEQLAASLWIKRVR